MTNNARQRDEAVRIRIADLLHTIVKHWKLTLLLTIIGFAAGLSFSVASYLKGEISREYAVKSSIAVIAQNAKGLYSSQSSSPTYNDVKIADEITSSVVYILKSDKTISAAIDTMGGIGVSASDVRANLTVSRYAETQIIDLTLYWKNADEGIAILNAINEVAPAILLDTLRIGNVTVVNAPDSKYLIGGSIKISIWGLATAFGFGIGILYSILSYVLNPTVLYHEDASESLGIDIFGRVGEPKKRALVLNERRKKRAAKKGLVSAGSFDMIARIFDAKMRTQDFRCVSLVSAKHGEGCSGAAVALAKILSGMEKKVLLLDLNFKEPEAWTLLGQEPSYRKTVNAFYKGDSLESEIVNHLNGFLDVIPAILEEDPPAIGREILTFVKKIAGAYDYVLIDTMPLEEAPDALALHSVTDGALYIIKRDELPVKYHRECLRVLAESGVSVIGGIIV